MGTAVVIEKTCRIEVLNYLLLNKILEENIVLDKYFCRTVKHTATVNLITVLN